MKIIDTHIHVWDLDTIEYPWLQGNTTILNRSYAIEELNEAHTQAGVTGGVLVQASNNFEDTDWMLEVAGNTNWILGVVGWLPLMDPDAAHKALSEKYLHNPYFKGVRHLIHDEKDPRWLLQEPVLESLKMLQQHNLSYDLVGVLPEHIVTALKVAEKIPGLRMVFDHLNQPPIQQQERYGKWGELMMEAAQHKNFYCKISGLGTTSGKFHRWTATDVRPYIEFALQHFGEERCFCGGDWPVSLLAGDYVTTWNAYQMIIRSLLDSAAQEKVFALNAQAFYHL